VATRDWNQTFSGWTGAEGTVEEGKAQRTITLVREALGARARLREEGFSVYPKGSYPNRTNVVRDSDIDIAAELTGLRNHEFIHGAEGLGLRDLGMTPYGGDYSVVKFKDDVEAALRAAFGTALVTRGNKAIRIKETSSTLPVDVVCCQTVIVHTSKTASHQGIKIWPDHGASIINYPKQHLEQGLVKNERTTKRYKRSVRILKRLENEMVSKGVIEVVPSFLIESLVWNCENLTFASASDWGSIIKAVIVESYNDTKTDEAAKGLLEANSIKFLFHASQGWTRQQANDFLLAAWRYVGYKN
jgi:hypothetical protein